MALTVVGVNPIKVTGTTSASQAIYVGGGKESLFIKRLFWLIPTTAGHKLALTDGDGNVIAEMQCETNGISPQILEIGAYYDGVYCTDMDSGTLLIYTQSNK
jgi:hypothetical protein